jgi:hypothetical protein
MLDPEYSYIEPYTPYGTVVPPGLPGTPFFSIYCTFLSNITDDLYLELTYEDTFQLLEKMLFQAIAMFKWPRFPKYAYNRDLPTMIKEDTTEVDGEMITEHKIVSKGCWTIQLTLEILSDLMMIKWMDAQLFTANNTKMKYSSADFKFTSQANHIAKLSALKQELERSVKGKQSLYRRQKVDIYGNVSPDYDGLAGDKLQAQGADWWNYVVKGASQSE